MDRNEMVELHEMAKAAVTAAHAAYEIALVRRTMGGDTKLAYDALIKANRVRDRIYSMLVALV